MTRVNVGSLCFCNTTDVLELSWDSVLNLNTLLVLEKKFCCEITGSVAADSSVNCPDISSWRLSSVSSVSISGHGGQLRNADLIRNTYALCIREFRCSVWSWSSNYSVVWLTKVTVDNSKILFCSGFLTPWALIWNRSCCRPLSKFFKFLTLCLLSVLVSFFRPESSQIKLLCGFSDWWHRDSRTTVTTAAGHFEFISCVCAQLDTQTHTHTHTCKEGP